VDIAGLILKNPVMTASGTFGYGREYVGLFDLASLGAVVVKGTTLMPRDGNPPPRVVETPSGMLNAIGLQNPGIDAFLATELPFLREHKATVILNIAGMTVGEYEEIARRVDGAEGLAAVEVNISCPNTDAGGMTFGVSPRLSEQVVSGVRRATRLPLIAKLSPNVTSITEIARACVNGGADAISLVNTLVGIVIDLKKRRPVLGNVTGGLSGPAIRPVAVKMTWEVASAVEVPVIGMGGISSVEDALEFMMAGATAVQVGSAVFANPMAPVEVVSGLERYVRDENLASIREIIGAARKK
jgi:dihydroorotate dehydrogenase (NAD+) catalytic subunit